MTLALRTAIACDAHGLCAELLPEMIALDDWGCPIVDGSPVAPTLLEHAQRATAACFTLALPHPRAPDPTPPVAALSGELRLSMDSGFARVSGEHSARG